MNITQELDTLLASKIEYLKDNKSSKYTAVILIDQDNIVYVGKTNTDINEYLSKKSEKYHFTDYTSKTMDKEEIDNYIAELILKTQPIYNTVVPKNTKYISDKKAKELHRIGKVEFKKLFNLHGGYSYGKSLYMEYLILIDVFGSLPEYGKGLPKENDTIVLAYDSSIIYGLGQETRDYLDENNRKVSELRNFTLDPLVVYEYYKEVMNNSFLVTEILNDNTFKAICNQTEKIKIFSLDSKGKMWTYPPSEQDEYHILKELESENINLNLKQK